MKKTFAALALAAALMPFTAAQAATISFNDATGLQKTGWTVGLRLGMFDSNLGTLNSIQFDLGGLVRGNGWAESDDAAATKVGLTIGSVLSLMRPDGGVLVVTNPAFTHIFQFSASDGVLDFGGASGGRTGTIETRAVESFVSTFVSDFGLFSAKGGGLIDLGVKADSQWTATGPGNLTAGASTFALGDVKITYDYTPFAVEVPEPATLATIFAGLGLMGAVRRRQAGKKA